MKSIFLNRFYRRLILVLIFLVTIDHFIPSLVNILENKSYNSQTVFRFEESDVFTIGPLVHYFQENPKSDKKRIFFLGHSVTWGYGIQNKQTLPYQFQLLSPEVHVYNMAYNGHGLGDSYLISKNIVASADVFFLLDPVGSGANSKLSLSLDISDDEAKRFGVPQEPYLERKLKKIFNFWNLYKYSYRLQSSIWNSSTVVYLYTYKRKIVSSLLSFIKGENKQNEVPKSEDHDVAFLKGIKVAELYDTKESDLCEKIRLKLSQKNQITNVDVGSLASNELLFDFAKMIYQNKKKMVLLGFDDGFLGKDFDRALFNCAFYPYVYLIKMPQRPRYLTTDGQHFNAVGASTYARLVHKISTELLGILQ